MNERVLKVYIQSKITLNTGYSRETINNGLSKWDGYEMSKMGLNKVQIHGRVNQL